MRLAITTSPDRVATLSDRASRRGIELIPLPLIRIEPIEFDWPADVLDVDVDWCVFGSANAVTSFFTRIRQLPNTCSAMSRIAALGPRTAEAIEDQGRTVALVGTGAGGKELFEEMARYRLSSGDTLVHARAEQIAYDPTELLGSARVRYVPLICYRTVLQSVSHTVLDQFSPDDGIFFTAPSTVESFHHQFGQPSTRTIAIGRTTAEHMKELGWDEPVVAPRPSIDSVLEVLPWS